MMAQGLDNFSNGLIYATIMCTFSSRLAYILILLGVHFCVSGQDERKLTSIKRTNNEPIIDGTLDDSCWNNAFVIEDFTQYEPDNGGLPSHETKVLLLYDDHALYVGAMMFDDPDSISMELCKRDEVGGSNVDVFAVHLSPYNDGNNSVFFEVSAAGVQTDMKFYSDEHDPSWDAVWESDVTITNDGWIAEFSIPYSALRFSKDTVQEWGFNIWRKVKRNGEWISWQFVDLEHSPWWRYMGILNGIENIKPSLRLSLTPYASGYYEVRSNEDNAFSYNIGMDMKYGISESFTFDMTLIPDFGQVQSDDEVLNLSPYEVFYNEKRQFFTEGMELFNKADLFYSRRIGGLPADYYNVQSQLKENEVINSNPGETKLINASKLSGRTKGGTGIGVLNAMSAETFADIVDTISGKTRKIVTQPFTNYSVAVIDQNLFDKSHISLINSNVVRRNYMANITGTEFRFADKENLFCFRGNAAYSHVNDDGSMRNGFKYYVQAGKINGRIQYKYSLNVISDKYEQNDLGYMPFNNEVSHSATVGYYRMKPKGITNYIYNELRLSYSQLYKPRVFTELRFDYEISTQFKNLYSFRMHAAWRPKEFHDYYEPREEDRYFRSYKFYHNCFSFNTNPTKRMVFFLHSGFTNSYDYLTNVRVGSVTIEPLYRFSSHFNMSYEFSYHYRSNYPGYVTKDTEYDELIFGARDRKTITNTLEVNYVFNRKTSISARVRHYWSKVKYNRYFILDDDGYLIPTDYHEKNNLNFNLFNVDMVLKWDFAPGSEMLVVWKNAILNSGDEVQYNYWVNFRNTIESPQLNSFSVKVLYYIDYQAVKNKFKR